MDKLFLKNRNVARSIVIQNDQILLILKKDDNGERYALPGGAQDLGETLESALQRECLEEIGTPVKIINLLGVAECFKSSSSEPGKKKHQIEFFFQCQLPQNYLPQNGSNPDKHQIGVVWLPIAQLDSVTIFPSPLSQLITQFQFEIANNYLGKIDE